MIVRSAPTTITVKPKPTSALGIMAASLAVGEWRELTTGLDGFLATLTEPLGGTTDPASGHVLGYIDKLCWDSVGKRILGVTSDHFHGTGKARFVQYEDATNTWSRLPEGTWFPSVTASAMHGYHHNAIDAVGRRLYLKRFAAAEVYSCDLSQPITANSWTKLPTPPTSYNASAIGCSFVPWIGAQGSMMAYQCDSGTMGSLYRYDVQNAAWTIPSNTNIPDTGDIHNLFEASPSIKYAVMGGGSGNAAAAQTVNILRPDGSLEIGAVQAPFEFNINDSILTHCPVSGAFLFFRGSTWYQLDAVTKVFTKMTGPAHIFDGGSQQGGGLCAGLAAVSIDTYGVILFLKMIGQNNGTAWLYRHA